MNTPTPRFVQIACSDHTQLALDANGSVWVLASGGHKDLPKGWYKIPDVVITDADMK